MLFADLVPGDAVAARGIVRPLEGICAAVHHAHGVVHGDLKPANLPVSASGVPVVLDFGVARAFGAGATSTALPLTRTTLVDSLATLHPRRTTMATVIPSVRALVIACGAAGFAAASNAQGRATLRAVEDVVASSPWARQVIPAGTWITSLQAVSAGAGTLSAFAGMQPRSPLGADLRSVVIAYGMLPLACGAKGALEWTLTGVRGGWLTLDMVGYASDGQALVSFTGPGLSVTRRTQHPRGTFSDRVTRYVELPAGGFSLRCDFAVGAAASETAPRAMADLDVRMDFTPALPPARQASYGVACGLGFDASDSTTLVAHVMTLDVRDAFSSSPVVFVFGGQRASIPIAGSLCRLLTAPVAAVAVGSDVAGNARWALTLPGPLRSAPFDVQALSIDMAARVRASHGIEMQFVD